MATTLNFKDKIDLPEWRPLANALANTAAGHYLAYDLRNNKFQSPYLWLMQALTTLTRYSPCNDAWSEYTAFTAVGGAIGAGSHCVFVPSHGPTGIVGGTPTTTSFQLAALPNSGSVLANQLANSGCGKGYMIRVIGKGAGSPSGKIEERMIVANTAGTTPRITVDVAFSFTPQTTDTYELLSGRIYMLGSGTTTAGYWKAFDIATGTISGNLNVTNLSATIGVDTESVMLDEQYVPYDRRPGEGMLVGASTYDASDPDGAKGCLLATAIAAGTITGQTAAGDSGVLQNEYRNFQIRIVEDTVNPTAVGQRRHITSHTAGTGAIYTLDTNWTVTPSANCKFVIELCNDLLLWTNSALVTYSYAAGGFLADGNWSTAAASGAAGQYANPGFAMGAGCCVESAFSIEPDTEKNSRHSYIFWLRGAASVSMQYFDIAGAATGAWTTIAPSQMTTVNLTTGTCSAHDPHSNQGRYMYITLNVTNRMFRFDMKNQIWEPWVSDIPMTQGTALVGGKLATTSFIDGTVKVSQLYHLPSTGANFYNCLLQR